MTKLTLTLLLLLLLLSPTRADTDTQHRYRHRTIHPNPTNFTLLGSAVIKNRAIHLTNGVALFSRPIRFLRPETRYPVSFSTRFVFSVSDTISFLITSSPRADPCNNATVAISVDFSPTRVGVGICGDNAGERAGVRIGARIPVTAWIEYSSVRKEVRVWVVLSGFRPVEPVMIAGVDLDRSFCESMFVGFSASNCRAGGCIIYKWTFTTYFANSPPPLPPPRVVEVVGPTYKWTLWLVVAAAAAVLVAVTVAMAFLCLSKNKKETAVEPRISLDAIRTATNGFDACNVLGRAGPVTTYSGILSNGSKVIAKKFTRVDEFTAALSAALALSPHANLVAFVGYCCEKDDLVLVYELLPNGTLHDALFSGTDTDTTLPWNCRYDIVLGLGAAIHFLHEQCAKKVIHNNITSRNIFLDTDFKAKLGAVGEAEMGYLAPEYVHSGVADEKTDVYSYGVVILEIATGKKAVDHGVVLVDWVWAMYGRKRLIEAADKKLKKAFESEEVKRVLMVGLWCVHPDCKKRIGVKKALRMLSGSMQIEALPERKPAVRLVSNMPSVSEESVSVAADGTQWTTPCVSLSK